METELKTRLAAVLAKSGRALEAEDRDIEYAFVREAVDRVIDGRDVTEMMRVVSDVYVSGTEEVKNQIVCGLIPSFQIRCVGRTTDIETYARYRSRVLPLLPLQLQSVWRHWDAQLPFGAVELLE